MDAGGVGDEGAVGLLGRDREERVALAQVDLADEAVGRCDGRDPGKRELLGQPVLEGAERALGAAPRFRGVGRDVLDPELGERPADLGQLILGNLLARLGRDEVVARRPCAPITSVSARKLLMVPSSSTRKAE